MKRLPIIAVLLLAACTAPPPTPQGIVDVAPTGEIDVPIMATAPPATPKPTPEPTATPEPTPTPTPVSYDPITFKASTDKKTKPFHIGTYGATMTLTVSGGKLDCKYALVSAYLFPVGEEVMYSGNLANEKCGTTEETEVFLEPGDYYVEWLIANVQGTLTIIPHD